MKLCFLKIIKKLLFFRPQSNPSKNLIEICHYMSKLVCDRHMSYINIDRFFSDTWSHTMHFSKIWMGEILFECICSLTNRLTNKIFREKISRASKLGAEKTRFHIFTFLPFVAEGYIYIYIYAAKSDGCCSSLGT